MGRQLTLITPGKRPSRPRPSGDWRLDERTKAVGRKGVAEAREILRRSAPKTAA